LEQHRAFEFRRGAGRRGPPIIRRFVGERIAGERPKFAEVRGAHEGTTARRHVCTKQVERIGIDDRWDRPARERRLQKVRARLAWLPAQARTDHYRVSPVGALRDWRLELVRK